MKETFTEILHAMGAVITWGGDDGPENNYGCMIREILFMKQAQFEWVMIRKVLP